jgi:hypothetical protein
MFQAILRSCTHELNRGEIAFSGPDDETTHSVATI